MSEAAARTRKRGAERNVPLSAQPGKKRKKQETKERQDNGKTKNTAVGKWYKTPEQQDAEAEELKHINFGELPSWWKRRYHQFLLASLPATRKLTRNEITLVEHEALPEIENYLCPMDAETTTPLLGASRGKRNS